MQRDRLLLAEILEAAGRILDLTGGRTADDIDKDRDRRDALLWNYTVLGEAVGQLSAEARDRRAEIDWADPVRLRNRIVHGYWSADLDVLIATARRDLPTFVAAVQAVLADLGPETTSSD